MKKKLRKPIDFGIANDLTSLAFKVNKEDLVIEVIQDENLWFEAGTARALAKKLIEAAEYLEQQEAA